MWTGRRAQHLGSDGRVSTNKQRPQRNKVSAWQPLAQRRVRRLLLAGYIGRLMTTPHP